MIIFYYYSSLNIIPVSDLIVNYYKVMSIIFEYYKIVYIYYILDFIG